MSILATITPAPAPRSDATVKISLLYAGLLVIMAVTQLFTFEEFLVYVQSIGLPVGTTTAYILAPLIIVAEVFALPFLLRMSLSTAFRYLSMFLGCLVAVVWLCISTWIVVSGIPVNTVGFLGTLVDVAPGWWAIFMSFAFVLLAVWSSWGLWPGKRTRN